MSVRDRSVSSVIMPAATIAFGCAALALRPPATVGAVVTTGIVGIAGMLTPLRIPAQRPSPLRWLAAVVLGVAAFVIARWMSPSVALPFWWPAAIANVVAAIAEEAFFRRLAFGVLSRWGVVVATMGTAVAFAAIHVPVYGPGVVPIDLAAGLLLGWQRWATGGWSAPAVTHVVANLLQMG